MPAIRDFTTNYTPSGTGTTLTIDTPIYEENDLLLAVICADTGTNTWSSPDWTPLITQTNTSQLAVLYKIASSSEPSSHTFTRTTTESFSGGIISIRDVDTTNPFGNPAVYTTANQAAASRYTMPSITTNRANSLIIYATTNSSQTGSPSFVEGPANYLFTVQGISESIGTGWVFKVSTGTSPTIYGFTGATGTGVNAVIQIAPPSSGATVIPPYCAADNSKLIDPIDGTAAYNGNTAFAATATTYFGTTLAGLTLANGTVAASADYGINPVHNVGQITTSAAGNWSGATKVLAAGNIVNVNGKNILVHTGPPTPLQYQRLTAAAAGKGIAFGMATSANNFKVWHVMGAGTSFRHSRDIPLVINSNNTSGVIGSAGSFDPSSVQIFGFFVASQATTAAYHFYSLWLLDTMVVAGGTANEPVDIAGINSVIQGHEHRASLLQGSNQLALYLPLQIGDGGSNPVYLDLNNTTIEFPTQYNKTQKKVNYCSVDNVAGLKYYAGSSDVIKHRNSVISSESRYFWGLHSSSSTSATYDFSGLVVIGAGTITLNRAITINQLTINDYSTIDASSATLNECTITNVPNTNNSIILSSTTVSNCDINVTTLSAGNYWCSVADPSIFSGCTFTGSSSAGHAIRITTPGTYTLSGNTFSSFGANGTTSAAIFNDSGGAVTLNIINGNSPTVRNGTGASTTVNNNVSIEITVKDEAGSPVQRARVAVFKASDMTELLNNTTNSSGQVSGSYNYDTDTDVIIRVRKASSTPKYYPSQNSGTITSSGLNTTITFIADTIAASSTNSTIDDDFIIDTTLKTIKHTSGTTVYSVNDLYTWLMDYFDDSTTMQYDSPMSAQTPTEYTLTNSWFMDNNSFKYLSGGAIQTSGQAGYNVHVLTVTGGTYNDPVSGDIGKTVVAGATSIGPLLDYEITQTGVSSKWYVRDTRTTPAQISNGIAMTITSGTGSGNCSGDSASGENIWSNIYTLGTLVSGTTLDVYQNDTQITPWWSSGHIDILVKVKEAGTEIDSGYLTILARKYSTFYDHMVINASSGRNAVPLAAFNDINNQTSEAIVAGYNDISISFGFISYDLSNGNGQRPYDVTINCANRSLSQVYEYLKYITRTGSSMTFFSSTDLPILGEYYQAVGDIRFTISSVSGAFTEGERIDNSTTGGYGYLVSYDSTNQIMVLRNVHGSFASGNSITNGSATATINNTPSIITQSKQAPFGTFAGGKFFGARGVLLINMLSSDANNYQLIDSTGETQIPPISVPLIVDSVASGDRVGVYQTTGDNTTINKAMFTAASGNNAGNNYFVIQGSIPADTPSSGKIKIVDVSDQSANREKTYTYTSWSGSTFSGLSPTLDRNYVSGEDTAYVPYIEEEATGSTVSKSITYVTDRYVVVVVRKKGIIPFIQKKQITSSGMTASAIRTTDSIVQ